LGPFAAYFGDAMQVGLAVVATALMVVSLNAYRRRSEGRYLMLALAFVCLCSVSLVTTLLELSAGIGPVNTRIAELYVIPSLEFLMGLSFLCALLWSPQARPRLKAAFPLAVLALGAVTVAAYAASSGGGGTTALPTGCVRPADGYLIVASSLGYNNSVAHGGPAQSWPVINAAQGTNVTITICNTYQQDVGFQVVHYLAGKVETVLPGQVMTLSFVADQRGTFSIYCSIFCPIHVYLQGGELNVD